MLKKSGTNTIVVIAAAVILFALPAYSQKTVADLKLRTLSSDMQVPWEIRVGPDGWLWAAGIEGAFIRLHPDTGERGTLLGTVPQLYRNATTETGLHGFDIAEIDGKVFVYTAHTYQRNDLTTALRILRLEYDVSANILGNPTTILENIGVGYTHSGSRIKYMPDKTIMITVGDGRIQPQPSQNLSSYSGKTLRIHPDGSFPDDNPFPNSPVWSWGHRNHQGLCISPKGIIYSSEHGEQTEDEINILKKARNYGWPQVEGYCNLPLEKKFCDDSNVVEPIAGFSPTVGIAGTEYFDNVKFPDWRNSLLAVSLKGSSLYALSLNQEGDSVLERKNFPLGIGRLRSICVLPDGRIFIGRSQGDHYGSKKNTDNAVIEVQSLLSSYHNQDERIIPTLHPTPNDGDFFVELPTKFQNSTLEVFSVLGENIFLTKINSSRAYIDISGCSQGVYYVCIKNNETSIAMPFIKN